MLTISVCFFFHFFLFATQWANVVQFKEVTMSLSLQTLDDIHPGVLRNPWKSTIIDQDLYDYLQGLDSSMAWLAEHGMNCL